MNKVDALVRRLKEIDGRSGVDKGNFQACGAKLVSFVDFLSD